MPGQCLGDGALAAGSRAINGDDEGRGGGHAAGLAGEAGHGKGKTEKPPAARVADP